MAILSNAGAQAGTLCAAPPSAAEIPLTLNRLVERLEENSHMLRILSERLSPVCRAEEAQSKVPCAPTECYTLLAQRIEQAITETNTQRYLLTSLMERLEL